MTRSRLATWLASLAALALLVAAGGLVMLRVARTQAIEEASALAAERFPGVDAVAALGALAAADDEALTRRNRAVWALGEMRDERALPVLERLHVQEECEHHRLVCQREVRKAMAKIRGELSLSASLRCGWQAIRERLGGVGGSASATLPP